MLTKEDYVTLEVAKKLKEKGFDEPCLKMIDVENGFSSYCDYDNICLENTLLKNGFISYPTLYEVEKWLRTTYNIFIHIEFEVDFYCFYITYIDEDGELAEKYYNTINSKSYEEAVNKAIIEALEFIY